MAGSSSKVSSRARMRKPGAFAEAAGCVARKSCAVSPPDTGFAPRLFVAGNLMGGGIVGKVGTAAFLPPAFAPFAVASAALPVPTLVSALCSCEPSAPVLAPSSDCWQLGWQVWVPADGTLAAMPRLNASRVSLLPGESLCCCATAGAL